MIDDQLLKDLNSVPEIAKALYFNMLFRRYFSYN